MIIYKYNCTINEYFIERSVLAQDPSQLQWVDNQGNIIPSTKILNAIDRIGDDLYKNLPEIYEVFSKKSIYLTDNCDSMATNGKCILMNPLWCFCVIQNAKEQGKSGVMALEYVIVHEMLHILFDHCTAIDDSNLSDLLRQNYAMDYEINYIIENYLYDVNGKLPFKGMTSVCNGCYSEDFGKKGLSWEEIYPIVPMDDIKRHSEKDVMSKEWNDGFIDGFNEVLVSMRKNNLVERYVI